MALKKLPIGTAYAMWTGFGGSFRARSLGEKSVIS